MAIRIRPVTHMEVRNLNALNRLRILGFWAKCRLSNNLRRGNGIVIVRDGQGKYQGYVSSWAWKKNNHDWSASLNRDRVTREGNTWESIRELCKTQKVAAPYCLLFSNETFEGVLDDEYTASSLVEHLEILIRREDWGAAFAKQAQLIAEGRDELADMFRRVLEKYPECASSGETKKTYRSSDTALLSDLGEFIRRRSLQGAFDFLDELGATAIITKVPEADELEALTEDEKLRSEHKINGLYQAKPDPVYDEQTRKVYGEDYDLWKAQEISCINEFYWKEAGVYKLVDRVGEHTNVIDGNRKTLDVPRQWSNHVYVLGPCTVIGMLVKDEDAIPSLLQRRLNESHPDEYSVVNLGRVGPARHLDLLRMLPIRRGDVFVFIDIINLEGIRLPKGAKTLDLRPAYNQRPKDCFFDSPKHVSGRGTKLIADAVWPELERQTQALAQREKSDREALIYRPVFDLTASPELQAYRRELERLRFKDINDRVGAVVMNCNPFTLGHRWLVEQARSQVDFLYVFVVEEDKSYFKFADRFEMVKQGVAGLTNVQVLPSGQYVASSSTFPEYFSKETHQDIIISASGDLQLFSMVICPALGIRKRFVGEEPLDKVTNQYNETMQRILPDWGVDVIVIPRRQEGGEVISASKVRRHYREADWDAVAKLVPESTLNYLKKLRG